MENEEVIRDDMEKTREEMTDKIETLEEKLVHSVTEATTAVTETVASVKETMHESVESVKDAVDVPAHVDRHPWVMLGGSILCGYVLGTLLERRSRPATPSPPPVAKPMQALTGNGHSRRPQRETPPPPPPPVPEPPGWLDQFKPEMQKLQGLALGVALGTVREMVSEEVPPNMAEQLRGIIDAVTVKVGGEPMPKSDFENIKKSPTSDARATGGPSSPDQARW